MTEQGISPVASAHDRGHDLPKKRRTFNRSITADLVADEGAQGTKIRFRYRVPTRNLHR
jgi:hypothetical protein